ncbi:MAG TPA: metallophosphoesterase [Wenzhouxiangella sp.]|nr:metallophosphoesterase [Wenzhouxiangella sp.]
MSTRSDKTDSALTVVQLSDTHLSADPQALYRGQNPDANLARLGPVIGALAPDLIVLTGDVSEDASTASYWRAGGFVRALAPQVAWLPGNHDRRAIMAGVFNGLGFDAGPIINRGGWQLVLLDSSDPDHPHGEFDERRLAPLDQMNPDSPALVFLHHQPLSVGSPWIDKYPLKNPQMLWNALDGRPVRAVAFGHVHQVFEGECRGIACLSAPSAAANSRRDSEKFTLDAPGPAVRWFRLWPDGRWHSGIAGA